MLVCVPVTAEGLIDPRWGRADRVAITEVTEDGIGTWREYEVGWNALHDAGTEGSHHARVARFLKEHHVEAVLALTEAVLIVVLVSVVWSARRY